MRHRLLAFSVLLALLAGVADASLTWIRAGACNVADDALGDVRLSTGPTGPTDASADKHVDLEAVYVRHNGRSVDVTIYAAELGAARRGTWLVRFTAGKTQYAVRASLGEWPHPTPAPAYSAGVYPAKLVPVKGAVDLGDNTVTVSAPYSVFGAAGRKGTRWGRFQVDAEEVLVDLGMVGNPQGAGSDPRLTDSASSSKTWRAGHVCPARSPVPPPPPPPGRNAR